MLNFKGIIALAAILVICGAGKIAAGVDVGMSIGQDGIDGFYLAIGENFSVSQERLSVIRKRELAVEETPVAFFIARHAGVSVDLIIDLRLGNASWMDIMLKYGLSPEILTL